MDLRQKKVLITGGDGGYGYGIAKVLKCAGCQVWITGRNAAKVSQAAQSLSVQGLVADASQGADWDRVFATIGTLDVLINNAGFGGKIVPTAEQSDADIAQVIATNLTGVIMGCARAARIMKAQKSGSIINISSVCAQYAWPGWGVYTAAKAGVAKFSKSLYLELRPFGVRVMCLTPSWGQTGFNQASALKGPLEDPQIAKLCTAPEDLGQIVKNMLETPDNLAIADLMVLPLVQEISPM